MAASGGNFGNFTPRAKRILLLAKQEAERLNHDHIGSEHLLLGLLALDEGVAIDALRSLGLNLDKLRMEVEKTCGFGGATRTQGILPVTPRLRRIFELATREAQSMNYNFVGSEHLLLALLREGEGRAARVLKNLNVTPEEVRRAVIRNLDSDFLPDNGEPDNFGPAPDGEPGESAPSDSFNALAAFGRNLTGMAARGELDPVIGRADEIQRVDRKSVV